MEDFPIAYEDSEIERAEALEVPEISEPEPSPPVSQPEPATGPLLQQLLLDVQDLRQEFAAKLKYDGSKERQIDNLYREVQEYREGLHFKILKPVLTDLIALYDDLGRLIEPLVVDNTAAASSSMYNNLKSLQATVEEILRRNGIEAYALEGDTYVPGKQRVLRTIATASAEEDKKIAQRLRPGFSYDERVLRPEWVSLYKFNPDM